MAALFCLDWITLALPFTLASVLRKLESEFTSKICPRFFGGKGKCVHPIAAHVPAMPTQSAMPHARSKTHLPVKNADSPKIRCALIKATGAQR